MFPLGLEESDDKHGGSGSLPCVDMYSGSSPLPKITGLFSVDTLYVDTEDGEKIQIVGSFCAEELKVVDDQQCRNSAFVSG